ncbi:MAG: bifunctional ornithine acetyltransferase/N-acetylglutamate synthase [Fimbriimonas sp.]
MIPKGFSFAGVRCGLKNKRNDVGLIVSDRPARAAGVFTTNHVRASSVDYSRSVVDGGEIRALVVNSGNANCCTGKQGERDTRRMAEMAAEGLGLEPKEVVVASTGVIGQLLDMSKVERGIAEASLALALDPVPLMDAILTTDLVEKWAWSDGTASLERGAPPAVTGGSKPCIYGIAKGSGMIAPNMATMLGFLVSDWDVSEIDLQACLQRVADKSFNCMTVDGDTSTNDMLVLMANGASGIKPESEEFERALTDVCVSLAKQVARDGEGATKLVEVRVTGSEDPKKIARTIADSPLVKTAMFGCDPNWGRILMAAGRAGVPFTTDDVTLKLIAGDEEFTLFDNGGPAAFDPKRVSTALKSDTVVIDLQVGEGEQATIYTCDFGYGYVRINAEYHT